LHKKEKMSMPSKLSNGTKHNDEKFELACWAAQCFYAEALTNANESIVSNVFSLRPET